jgi:hypothetical protein
MYRSNAACWLASRTSPVVESQITAAYLSRLASVNAAASSVASTVKPLSAPSCWIAAMPAGIERWRKPAVFEKTRTE